MSNYPRWIGSKPCDVPANRSSAKATTIQNIGLTEYTGSTANVMFARKWYWR